MLRKLAIIAPLTLFVQPAFSEIVITTEEYPPFNMTYNGDVAGISTDLVKAIFAKAAVPYHIEVLPWQRAYTMALNDKDTCVYSTTETDERKALFEWVGPLVHNNWALFARDENAKPLASLEEAKGKIIGGYNGDALTLYLQQNGYTVDVAPKDDLNPPKLVNGRIDYWATGSELGPFVAAAQGIKAIKPVLTFKDTVMSLACNKQTDPAVLEKVRAALADLRKAK